MKNPHTPEFSNAMVGDACFSVANGIVEIEDIVSMLYPIHTSDSEYYDISGRYLPSDKHPSLFNSFQQFMDYWKWEQDNRGEDA